MFIDILKAKNSEEERFPFDGAMHIDSITLCGDVADGNLSYEGEYSYFGESLSIFGKLKLKVKSVCDRCGMPFSYEIEASLDEHIPVESPDYDIKGDDFNLGDFILEKLVLSLPSKRLCRADCKGLCLACGKNLNIESCECESEIDERNPFYILLNKK